MEVNETATTSMGTAVDDPTTMNQDVVTADGVDKAFQWTAATVFQCIGVFLLAGVAEILGGWFVWQAVRGKPRKPWWYAVIGSLVLTIYGFVPCLQPTDSFGRIYAVYGGFFIVLSFLFGWVLDGDKPDVGDVVGGSIALVGVCIIMFWPR
jgi:drug/metabolite transporter superfamily protein YnfA